MLLSAVDIFVYDESNLPMTSTVSIGNAVIGDTDSSGKISYMLPYGGYTISATQSGSVIGTTEILVDGKTTSFAITSSNVIPTPSPSPTPTPSPEYDVIKIDNATNTLSVKVDNRTPKALYIASYDEDNSLKSVQVKYAINGFNINLSDIDYDKIFLWEADTQKPLDVFIK